MVNTPIPHSLKSEAKKAAKILREFTMPNTKTGPDKLIPVGILAKARGLAILTVFKAGFLVTARGGSGIVIAKVGDQLDYSQGWSAPSAIGLAGLGGGFEIGMEVTDFVIILNTQAAVDAFSKGGNLTLGGNFTIAVGPLGRNIEGDVALRSPAAIYTYSKTKGIFAGISVEGSALIERKDANRKFYERDIRAYEILAGEVPPPEGCEALYLVMKEHQELAARAALQLAKRQAAKHADAARDRLADETGLSLPSFSKSSKTSQQKTESSSFFQKTMMKTVVTKKVSTSSFASASSHSGKGASSSPDFSRRSGKGTTPSPDFSRRTNKGASPSPDFSRHSSKGASHSPNFSRHSGRGASPSPDPSRRSKQVTSVTRTTTSSTSAGDPRRRSMPDMFHGSSLTAFSAATTTSPVAIPAIRTPARAVALFSYRAQLSCDLSFDKGDKIEVLTRTDTQDDWWEGRTAGRLGIFPANYVSLL